MFSVYNKVTLKTKTEWYHKILYSYKQENNRQKNKKEKKIIHYTPADLGASNIRQ